MSIPVDDTSPFGTYPRSPFARRFYASMGAALDWGWLGRRVVGRLRRIEPVLFGEEIVDTERFGLRWRLYQADNYGEKVVLLRPHRWERVEQSWILDSVEPGFAFVDVGANCGVYALRTACLAAGSAKVAAIEPSPVLRARLRFNAQLNPGCPVRILGCAVGDRAETVRFSEPASLDLGRVSRDGLLEVEMRTLLEILETEEFDRLDALKVDVEGYEDRVLGPFLTDAPDSLLPAIIVVEHIAGHRWETGWFARALARGYREQGRTRTNLLLARERKPGRPAARQSANSRPVRA